MTGVILRIDIQKIGATTYGMYQVTNCFLVKPNIVIASYSGINKNIFETERPAKHSKYVILIEGESIFLSDEEFFEFPELEITLIRLKKSFEIEIPELSTEFELAGVVAQSQGFKLSLKPHLIGHWEGSIFSFNPYDLGKCIKIKKGTVDHLKIIMKNPNIPDMKLHNAKTHVMSYGGELALMIGSAVINTVTKEIIGMIYSGENMFFRNELEFYWAISSVHILEALKTLEPKKKQWWKFW